MSALDKKILILYATAGSGHKKAAEAINHSLSRIFPNTRILDVVDFLPKLTSKLYTDGYTFLIKQLPSVWGALFFLSDTYLLKILNVYFRKFLNRILCKRLIKLILEINPEIIISTHFLTSEVASYAKLKYGLKSKLITVITDFGVHNFWIAPKTDIYCCASTMTKEILINKGIPESKIKITGIPLDEKFLKVPDRTTISQKFKLDPNLFTSLIITGGIGAGPIEDIVELIRNDSQVLVVCGNNKTLKAKLEQKKYPNVRTFGFVDFVEQLMAASDIIITKAGGLTITESLAMLKPMIFFFLIPGQEQINAKIICKENAGIYAKTTRKIRNYLLNFKNNPARLDAFKKCTQALSKPNSIAEIISLIE